jgi:muramoyltetrapeptide carboxypeptidase
VGVPALSGPVDAERLARGLEALARLGFEPVLGENLVGARDSRAQADADGLRRTGGFSPAHLAGSDEERLAAFHRLAADPGLSAIFFARGGYGVLRLLDRIDWDLLARHPRAYVGYSDLTPLLAEVVGRLGLAAFHGPMVAADLARGLSPAEEASLLGALAGELPAALPVAAWLAPGEAEGALAGGCLSLLAAAAGTAFAPDLGGAVVFLEDLGEPLYRLDRLLTQLRLGGLLAGAAGFVVGHVDLPLGQDRAALAPLFADRLGDLGVPVALGLAAGHSPPNLTLPLGLACRLSPGEGLEVGISSNQ